MGFDRISMATKAALQVAFIPDPNTSKLRVAGSKPVSRSICF